MSFKTAIIDAIIIKFGQYSTNPRISTLKDYLRD